MVLGIAKQFQHIIILTLLEAMLDFPTSNTYINFTRVGETAEFYSVGNGRRWINSLEELC